MTASSSPGPWRHRHAYRGQRLVSDGAKLKSGANRDRHTHAALNVDDARFVVLLSPHLAAAREEEPDFFDRSMRAL
jgi:hypothetical protein